MQLLQIFLVKSIRSVGQILFAVVEYNKVDAPNGPKSTIGSHPYTLYAVDESPLTMEPKVNRRVKSLHSELIENTTLFFVR